MTELEHHNGYASAMALRRTQSLTGIAVATIEKMILSGLVKSGERLNEQTLATQLGISRAPIREAARILERAGLLTAAAFHGACVRTITEREAGEIDDVLAVVFGVLCRRAAERLTGPQARAIETVMRRIERAVEADDVAAYVRLEAEFQMLVCECAGHRCATQTFEKAVKERTLKRAADPLDVVRVHRLGVLQLAAARAILDSDAAVAGQCGEAAIFGRAGGPGASIDDGSLQP